MSCPACRECHGNGVACAFGGPFKQRNPVSFFDYDGKPRKFNVNLYREQ